MLDNQEKISYMFKVKIEEGKGSFEFPMQLRQDLFQNFGTVRGLYSEKRLDDYVFCLSNLSEHGWHKSVIRNVLGTFNFKIPKLFQANPLPVKAAINILPRNMYYYVTDQSFDCVKSFTGWAIVEIFGERRKNDE